MTKSDLKSYIRENIIEILSEESVEDIEAQTDAYKDLAKAKEEAGIEIEEEVLFFQIGRAHV